MSDDTEKYIEDLAKMVSNTTAAQFILQGIEAYDKFATAALTVILGNDTLRSKIENSSVDAAEYAWIVADRMMSERKKRGIGGAGVATEEEVIRQVAETMVPIAQPTSEDNKSRCAVCGQALAKSVVEGCVRGNCAYRDRRKSTKKYYSEERAKSEYACDGCAKVARHPDEGYACMVHDHIPTEKP